MLKMFSVLTCLCFTDPWQHVNFRDHLGWLMELDMDAFRNKALQAGLISAAQRDDLAALVTDGPLVHNSSLLSFVKAGGRKTFRLLLDTLSLMGERMSGKQQELFKLLSPQTGK